MGFFTSMRQTKKVFNITFSLIFLLVFCCCGYNLIQIILKILKYHVDFRAEWANHAILQLFLADFRLKINKVHLDFSLVFIIQSKNSREGKEKIKYDIVKWA